MQTLPILALIPDGAVDLTFTPPQYTSDLNSTLGNIGTNTDGTLELLNALMLAAATTQFGIDALDSGLVDLGVLAIDAGKVWEADFAGTLASAISGGDAAIAAVGADLSPTGEPSSGGGTGSGGSGGGNAPSSDCSNRTNQYGISKTGSFPGVNCFLTDRFQVLRVQDGPCTYRGNIGNDPGHLDLPTYSSFTLLQGDSTVFALSRITLQATDGTPYDMYQITITPKLLPVVSPRPRGPVPAAISPKPVPMQNPTHFDAVGALVVSNRNETLMICISVDCIP